MSDAHLIEIPENPLPEGMSAHFIEAADGARLRIATLPKLDHAKGSFLVVPGWAEFIEKYAEVATELRDKQYNVMICDPRGQGYSHRVALNDDRALIDDFRKFVRDMDEVFADFVSNFPAPHYLLAHSMGGTITLEWLATGDRPVDGVVLSAPFTRLYPSGVKRFIVRTMARTALFFRQARRPISVAPEQSMYFPTNKLTQDPIRHDRFKKLQLKEPDSMAGHPRYAWVNAAMAAHLRIDAPGALSGIKAPVLLVSADWDETVDPTHHHELAERYPFIKLVTVPGARHELLMEKDEYREQFWAAFDDFMAARQAEADSVNMPPEPSSAVPESTRSSNMSAS
ncbi:alpha/beta hydrolase [Parvularcula marina]|uniref:alpha/beta hydrolase n=1 Tax=Parvularcula marina TaxID=2292771 RepID=UPI003511E566